MIGTGPVAQALMARQFKEAYLLYDHEADAVRPYLNWLEKTLRRHHPSPA